MRDPEGDMTAYWALWGNLAEVSLVTYLPSSRTR